MWRSNDIRRAFATLSRYGRPSLGLLASGLGATLLVVGLRLAIPWPLRGVVELAFPGHGHTTAPTTLGWIPSWADPTLWFAGAYLVLALGTGLADMAQRVRMKQFGVALVHDLRADAVRSATRREGRRDSGDVIARVIGDSARLKEGLSGVLVHLSQNGLLFLGVVVVFLVLHPVLGLVFAVGGALSIAIGFLTVPSVASVAESQRTREGRYAEKLRRALESGSEADGRGGVDRASARGDVLTTRLITRSTVAVHAVQGFTVGAGLWIGVHAVRNGSLAPGALFLFIAYALTVHRRVVQVGRQIARSGKVLASAARIAAEVEVSPGVVAVPAPRVAKLREGVRYHGVAPAAARGSGEAPLTLAAASKVAVLGGREEVSRLLRVVAGREAAGPIVWDGEPLSREELAARAAYLAPLPSFPRARLWRVLGLDGPWALGDSERTTLKRIGAWSVIKATAHRLRGSVGSRDVREADAHALVLAGALLSPAPLLVLDRPLEGTEAEARRRRLREILLRGEGRTLVVGLETPRKLSRFDRVLVVDPTGITYDGPPASLEARRVAEVG